MRLFIGGRCQGKLEYCSSLQDGAFRILDGAELPAGMGAAAGADLQENSGSAAPERIIFNHLHEWIRICLKENTDPAEELTMFLEKYPDADIVCDEVGNGIVPIEPFEREWRETVGRTLIILAKQAQTVTRVVCGLPQIIKNAEENCPLSQNKSVTENRPLSQTQNMTENRPLSQSGEDK